jgi:methyl-accepting chemotaxis protein
MHSSPSSSLLGNLRVGQKIFLIVAVIAVLLGLVLAVSFTSFQSLERSLTEVRDEGVPNAMVAKDMQMQVVQIQQWLTDISATRGQDGLDDGFKEAEKAHAQFLADLNIIAASYAGEKNQEGVANTETLKQRMDAWYGVGKKMAKAYIDGGAPEGNKVMGEFDKVSTQLQEAMEPIIKSQVDEATREIAAAISNAQRVQNITLIGIVLAVIVLAAGGVMLSNGIARPLAQMSQRMADLVSHRDFSVRVEVSGNDEIASAGRSFNELVSALHAILRELNEDVHRVDGTAKELAEAVANSAQSSQTTSSAASSMAAAVEQMSVSLDQMRDNTNSALDIVSSASRYSQEGSEVIGKTVADMQRISSAVQQTADVIAELGQQTGQISGIVAVIREVADQTNLLALNAAIEAARAGEQGRGFAVVADEVRKLAERTSGATQEIGSRIEAIQGSSAHAVERMQAAVHEANAGAKLASEAGTAISGIRQSTTQVAAAFHDIVNAIAEQSAAGRDIAIQVEAVAQASDENSIAVGHTADAAKTLENLSHSIRGQIDQFKV